MDTFDPALLLALVFGLSFSALLLRKRVPKFQALVPILCYLAIGPWLICLGVSGSVILISTLRGIHWTSDMNEAAFLLWILVTVIFGVLAHRRKDVLLLTTTIVTVVIGFLVLVSCVVV